MGTPPGQNSARFEKQPTAISPGFSFCKVANCSHAASYRDFSRDASASMAPIEAETSTMTNALASRKEAAKDCPFFFATAARLPCTIAVFPIFAIFVCSYLFEISINDFRRFFGRLFIQIRVYFSDHCSQSCELMSCVFGLGQSGHRFCMIRNLVCDWLSQKLDHQSLSDYPADQESDDHVFEHHDSHPHHRIVVAGPERDHRLTDLIFYVVPLQDLFDYQHPEIYATFHRQFAAPEYRREARVPRHVMPTFRRSRHLFECQTGVVLGAFYRIEQHFRSGFYALEHIAGFGLFAEVRVPLASCAFESFLDLQIARLFIAAENCIKRLRLVSCF